LKFSQEIDDGRVHIAEIEKICWNEFLKIYLKRANFKSICLKFLIFAGIGQSGMFVALRPTFTTGWSYKTSGRGGIIRM
jgi:hypothetical protein